MYPAPTPCDFLPNLGIPVYSTYESAKGVVAFKEMFGEYRHIILRWFGDDRKMHDILVGRPDTWFDGRAYYDTNSGEWNVTE